MTWDEALLRTAIASYDAAEPVRPAKTDSAGKGAKGGGWNQSWSKKDHNKSGGKSGGKDGKSGKGKDGGKSHSKGDNNKRSWSDDRVPTSPKMARKSE